MAITDTLEDDEAVADSSDADADDDPDETEDGRSLRQAVTSEGPLTPEQVAKLHRSFNSVYLANAQLVGARLRRWGLAPAEVADKRQVVFLKFFEKLCAGNVEEKSEGLLCKLADGLALNHLRDNRKAPVTLGVPPSQSETLAVSSRGAERKLVDRQLVERLAREMPDAYVEVLQLVDINDLSYEEAAAVLGISVAAVRSRLFKARRAAAEIAKLVLTESERRPQ
jgi:RNA polymerase sigma-70 factor (ECF subfamily)